MTNLIESFYAEVKCFSRSTKFCIFFFQEVLYKKKDKFMQSFCDIMINSLAKSSASKSLVLIEM